MRMFGAYCLAILMLCYKVILFGQVTIMIITLIDKRTQQNRSVFHEALNKNVFRGQ